jgi:hypothetical protein
MQMQLQQQRRDSMPIVKPLHSCSSSDVAEFRFLGGRWRFHGRSTTACEGGKFLALRHGGDN